MPARDFLWFLWEWSEDAYLKDDLIYRAAQENLRVRFFGPGEFHEITRAAIIASYPLILWDRAGDVHREALRLSDWAEALGSRVINPARSARLIQDKANLHRLLLQHDLPVPQTRFLADHCSAEELRWACGKYLVLKPVRSGGGEGVRIQEWNENSIWEAMRIRPGEIWLLQEYIEPALVAGRRAWFRVYYLFGEIRICWWDNRTHVYDFMPCREVDQLGFGELRSLVRRIGESFPLQLFSTEIVYREDGRPIIVDYINDPCDLRRRSRVPDGVPDELLNWVYDKIFATARLYL